MCWLQPHIALLGMTFYEGKRFPAEYLGDIFAAHHSSWNRSNRVDGKGERRIGELFHWLRVSRWTVAGGRVGVESRYMAGPSQEQPCTGRGYAPKSPPA